MRKETKKKSSSLENELWVAGAVREGLEHDTDQIEYTPEKNCF